MRKKEDQPSGQESEKKLIAKKDWRILAGNYLKEKDQMEIDITIKKGDDVSDLPHRFLVALRTENVI